MILPGLKITARGLVQNLRNQATQQQPCGIDLTLRHISRWTSSATIDFDNSKRSAAATQQLPFNCLDQIKLGPGAYLVDFNESVRVPLDCMGSVYGRSSLWRSGVSISAGVVDAGYEGAMGALMEVLNPHGVCLYRGGRLAQVVFEEMAGRVGGYRGVYQGAGSSVGRDGVGEV
ncbi:hypothetical protein N7466_009827 [Penicillium verhagenii]|uniref:uncharacterized protein n=1 Tax=Penicillium verhagenii TaxID=1562060 RepID=UPI0025458536|nr:uncharacterized protein N7466_009827 [Penicillium verhagenii]KAJ5921501.1 hypothetical protein N7466_009827 [Penicillium verhagenii]